MTEKKLIDLGWGNGWEKTPEMVITCGELGHHPSDVDEGPPNRGLQHHVICWECGYEYFYDSSD